MIDRSKSQVVLAGDFGVVGCDMCGIEGVVVELFLVVMTVRGGDGNSDGDGKCHTEEYLGAVDYYKGGNCREVEEECSFG